MLAGTISSRRRLPAAFPPVLGAPRIVAALGPAGAWDAADVNDPNVMFEPTARRWLMQYTGHVNVHSGNTDIDQEQKYGYAWADLISGVWSKDARNPVFAEGTPTRHSMNGGLVRLPNGTWLQAYTSGGSTTKFATSPDLYTWTTLSASFPNTWDAFLRLKPDGRVECFYVKASDGLDPLGRPSIRTMWRAVSADGGQTWTQDASVYTYAPSFVRDGPGWGEFAVWHQPGYEDQRIIICADANLTAGSQVRSNVIGRTLDGRATWTWAILNQPSGVSGDWNSTSVFDVFPVIAEDKFLVFFSGSPTNTILLDGSIQIGVREGRWDPVGITA